MAVGRLQLPQQQATAGQPVRLAPRPPMLAGREELLAELDARLAAGDGPGPRIVALCGLGGAGKTSVAVEYAYRHLAEVGVAWQFAAEDATVLAAGFGELAAQLGARGLADARDPVASVHAVLARFAAPWLLIFDNAADMASVAAFLPPAGPGRVLITSQNPNWPGQALDVPVLDPDVAAGFLVSRTGDPDRQAARDLAGDAGRAAAGAGAGRRVHAGHRGHPGRLPGLVPAAAGRAAGPRRAHRIQQDGGEHLGAGVRPPAADRAGRGRPAAAAGVLRARGDPAAPAAATPPGLAGRLGDEVAPVLAPLLEDPLAAGDAIAALRRYSLVTPAADGSVSVHRLVQAVTADQMPAELARQWRQAAAALIEAAIPGDTEPPETWPVCAALLPHAQAALADDSDGMARIADYLGYSGSYAAARDLQRRVLDARERVLGPEHPDTLTARANLARWTGQAGDPAAARDQFAALLPVLRAGPRPGAPGHPGRPRQPRPLDRGGGDPAAARDLFAALLPVASGSGPEHPDTLTARATSPLDRGGGGPGRRPGPVRRAAAVRERVLARSTRTPWPPARASPAGPGRRGTRPRPGTSSPRCCPCASGSSARSTRTP